MKNLQPWIFNTLMGCTQIDAAGKTDRAGVSLSSRLQQSLIIQLSTSKWKLMKWWQLGPLHLLYFICVLPSLTLLFPSYTLSHKCLSAIFISSHKPSSLCLSTFLCRQLNDGCKTRQKGRFTIEQKVEVWHASASHDCLSLTLRGEKQDKFQTANIFLC